LAGVILEEMFATILLDSFTTAESRDLADALDTICSPEDTYGFASACVYAFWSIPTRDILYIFLSVDVAARFRQHAGLAPCEAASCKREQIEAYFADQPRLGYSIMVQSALDQPITNAQRKKLLRHFDDDFILRMSQLPCGKQNVVVGEGLLLELYRELGGLLPPWNKIHGSLRGRQSDSFWETHDRIQLATELIRTKRSPQDILREPRPESPPYELLLNLTGHEISPMNALSTLREVASDPVIEGYEETLHAVRLRMLLSECSFEQAMRYHEDNNPDDGRLKAMREERYLQRKLRLPGT
jgi:hypothetical protein